jgi:hypothetical protein
MPKIMQVEKEIHAALVQLVELQQAPGQQVLKLDQLLAAHGQGLPGDLKHYLQRRSYHKALAFCQEQCGQQQSSG